jgi:uncharacterized protein (DUF302 family)
MDFTYRVAVDTDVDTTIDAVTIALKDQGFGVLTRIDVDEVLKQKIGVDVERQVILGACNPQLAHRALEADSRIGALLPCNVVVRSESGGTVIEALDPQILAEVAESDALRSVADDASDRIRAALDAVSTRSAESGNPL